MDDVSNHNPIFVKGNQFDAIDDSETGGRTLVEEIAYAENSTFIRFANNQTLNTGFNTTMTAFEYDWKQWGICIGITGRDELMNSGPEGYIKLLKSRFTIAENTLKNKLYADFLSDGTADGGLQIGGLALGITATPSSGSLGGITRSAGSFAQNYYFGGVTNGTGAKNTSNIKGYLTTCIINTTRMEDRPKLLLQGKTDYATLMGALQANQFITDPVLAKAGYENIVYQGIPAVLGAGVNLGGETLISDTATYGLNFSGFKLRMHKDCNMTPLPEIQSFNQYAKIQLIVSMGNVTWSAPFLNFLLNDS